MQYNYKESLKRLINLYLDDFDHVQTMFRNRSVTITLEKNGIVYRYWTTIYFILENGVIWLTKCINRAYQSGDLYVVKYVNKGGKSCTPKEKAII